MIERTALNWGLSTLGCHTLSLAEAAALADEFDFRFIEIRAVSGTLDLPEVFKQEKNREALRKLTAAGRVRVLDTSFGITSEDAKAREALLALGEIADRYGIPYLRVFGGFPFAEPLTEARLEAARRNLAWWETTGIKAQLALETHDGFSSAERCGRLNCFVGKPLPVVWDMHHTFLAGETFAESYKLLGQVIDVHVKDGVGHTGTLPGEGTVPVPEFLDFLTTIDYTGPVTLEYEKMWQPDLPEIRVALEALTEAWRGVPQAR